MAEILKILLSPTIRKSPVSIPSDCGRQPIIRKSNRTKLLGNSFSDPEMFQWSFSGDFMSVIVSVIASVVFQRFFGGVSEILCVSVIQ